MTNGEVVLSLVDYSKEFIQKYQNPNLEQNLIDAIVVDYINYFSVMQCRMDLAFYTKDLRDGKKMSEESSVITKGDIYLALNLQKDEYLKSGVAESLNKNSHMNQCGGKVKVDNAKAEEVIEEFIKGYMTE